MFYGAQRGSLPSAIRAIYKADVSHTLRRVICLLLSANAQTGHFGDPRADSTLEISENPKFRRERPTSKEVVGEVLGSIRQGNANWQ